MPGGPAREHNYWYHSRNRVPTLAWELKPWLPSFLHNLADCFRPVKPQRLTVAPGRFWPDVFVETQLPWKDLARSACWHAFSISVAVFIGSGFLQPLPVVVENPVAQRTITYYQVSEYLPQIPGPRPQLRQRLWKQADPAYAKQEILSVRVNSDNTRQTIVQPSTPQILVQNFPVPNLVIWSPVPQAPPVAALQSPKFALPSMAVPVVAPQPDMAQQLSRWKVPAVAKLEAVAPTTELHDFERKLSDLNIAHSQAQVEIAEPKLPVAAGLALPSLGASEVVPPPPTVSSPGSGMKSAGQLVALSVAPEPVSGPISVPEGSKNGTFEASPSGKPGASGAPSVIPGTTPAEAFNPLSGISISGGKPVTVVPEAPVTPMIATNGNPIRDLMHAAARSQPLTDVSRSIPPSNMTAPRNQIEDKIFKDRRSYSMIINMPNLNSAGGSWIVHFAELGPSSDRAELIAPVAVDKVDPGYPADLIHDRVEGTVVLYAVIRSDGSVSDVKVLDGFNDRLDASAIKALARWHFRPATKNGAPVDLEAVVQIPFRARKFRY